MTTLPEDVQHLIWRHYFSNAVLPDLPPYVEPPVYESIYYFPIHFYYFPIHFWSPCPWIALQAGVSPLYAKVTVKQPPSLEEAEEKRVAAKQIEKQNARHLLHTQRVQTRSRRQSIKCHANHQRKDYR